MRWLRRWLRFLTASMAAFTTLVFVIVFLAETESENASAQRSSSQHQHEHQAKSIAHLSHHNHHEHHHNHHNQVDSYAVTFPVPISSNRPFISKHHRDNFSPAFHLKRNSSKLPEDKNLWLTNIEEHRLLAISDFEFLKNGSHVCSSHSNSGSISSNDIFLVALVHSAPNNFNKRSIIRKTWGSIDSVNGLTLKVVFLIGIDETAQKKIDEENVLFNDLIQGKFIDSYSNLTLKHLSGYRWVLEHCNFAKFVMKTDDDAFIDIFNVVKVLHNMILNHNQYENTPTDSHSLKQPRDILACSLFPDGSKVKREGKWSLSYVQYPFETYPAYCSGVGYFITVDVLYDIFQAAHQVHPVLSIDDVFLTGIVASTLKLDPIPLNHRYVYEHKKLYEWLYSGINAPSSYLFADIGDVGDFPVWRNLMLKLWIKTLKVWNQQDHLNDVR